VIDIIRTIKKVKNVLFLNLFSTSIEGIANCKIVILNRFVGGISFGSSVLVDAKQSYCVIVFASLLETDTMTLIISACMHQGV
jgi:hypothetical protein